MVAPLNFGKSDSHALGVRPGCLGLRFGPDIEKPRAYGTTERT